MGGTKHLLPGSCRLCPSEWYSYCWCIRNFRFTRLSTRFVCSKTRPVNLADEWQEIGRNYPTTRDRWEPSTTSGNSMSGDYRLYVTLRSQPLSQSNIYTAIFTTNLLIARLAPVNRASRWSPWTSPPETIFPSRYKHRKTRLTTSYGSFNDSATPMVVFCASTCSIWGNRRPRK